MHIFNMSVTPVHFKIDCLKLWKQLITQICHPCIYPIRRGDG